MEDCMLEDNNKGSNPLALATADQSGGMAMVPSNPHAQVVNPATKPRKKLSIRDIAETGKLQSAVKTVTQKTRPRHVLDYIEQGLWIPESRQKTGPGIDGETSEQFKLRMKDQGQVMVIVDQLLAGAYRPSEIVRKEIPKANSDKLRPLGIPTFQDRMVQTVIAAELAKVLEPAMHSNSLAYREKRNTHQAVALLWNLARQGYYKVIEIDFHSFFDYIPHDRLLKDLEPWVDEKLLQLCKAFLEAEVYKDMDGKYERVRHELGEGYGAPQGGVISPILANLYLTKFDRFLEAEKHMFVRYADDSNILGNNSIWRSATVIRRVSEFIRDELQLTLKKGNPLIVADISQKPITFLGYQIQYRASMYDPKENPHGIAVQIPDKKVKRLVDIIGRASSEDFEPLSQAVEGALVYWSQAHETKATLEHLHEIETALKQRGLYLGPVFEIYRKHHKRIWQSIPKT